MFSIVCWAFTCVLFFIIGVNEPLLNVQVSLSKFQKQLSEYDQELPQSQAADNLVALQGRAAQPSPDTRKTN